MKIEEILAAKSQALDTHNSHPAQIKKQINKAFELACQLNFCNYNKLNFAAQVMCDYVLFSIKSTLDAMSRSFDDESYSTVEVLSRVSIEYSVNLMYVLVEDTKSRSLAFLNKYVTSKKKNSQNWLVAAKSENDLKRVRLASNQVELFETLEKSIMESESTSEQTQWPSNVYQKFELLGLATTYRTIYSAGSDSVHSLSEDVFNLFLANHPDLPFHDSSNDFLLKQKKSFSVYLWACSALFFCKSVQLLSKSISDDRSEKEAAEIYLELGKIIESHEDDIFELDNIDIKYDR